jgi:hypothetical protein
VKAFRIAWTGLEDVGFIASVDKGKHSRRPL